jgi:hypothetical protein
MKLEDNSGTKEVSIWKTKLMSFKQTEISDIYMEAWMKLRRLPALN